jgi:hypothetical protein
MKLAKECGSKTEKTKAKWQPEVFHLRLNSEETRIKLSLLSKKRAGGKIPPAVIFEEVA